MIDNWRFVHVPRTGGASFRQLFGRGFSLEDSEDHHVPARLCPDEVFLWAIVREPTERLRSVCAYELVPSPPLTRDVFERWVAEGYECPRHQFQNGTLSTPTSEWIDDRTHLLTYGWVAEQLVEIGILTTEQAAKYRQNRVNNSRYEDFPIDGDLLYRIRADYAVDFALWEQVSARTSISLA